MIEVFLATLSPMLVLFICILVGIFFTQKQLVPQNSDKVISTFENNVFIPALTIVSFMNNCTVESIKENAPNLLYCSLSLAITISIALLLARHFEKDDYYVRNIYKYALSFANCGFMGNSIIVAVLSASDSTILYKYLLFTLPQGILTYTWGIYILTPKENRKGNAFMRLINPSNIALIIGAFLGLSGTAKYLPNFVVTTLNYFSNCMSPLAMVLTGLVIGGYSIRELLSNKKVYIATALRLFVIPTIVVSVLKLCGASNTTLIMALIATGTPLGLNTIVFPSAFGGDTHTGASMAVISHTLCVITIPFMYSILVSTF